MTRTGLIAGIALAVLCAVAAPPAGASDAGLRRVVVRYEQRVHPLAVAFRRADAAAKGKSGADAAFAAAGRLRGGLHRFKVAVVLVHTQSTRSAAAKRGLLRAIREFDLGLVQYQRLVFKVKASAPSSSIKSSFLRTNRRLVAAARHEAAALRLL